MVDPLFLPDNQIQWSFNQLNRGGLYSTRPGYGMLYDSTRADEARGFTIFQPKGSVDFMVKAIGTTIRISPYPFTSWSTLAGITLDPLNGPVYFETCVKGARTESDGSLTILDAFPVLMIQTGLTRAFMWDGTNVTILDPMVGAPIGTWMKWTGDRLWLISGNKVFASNLLAPDQFLNDGSTLAGAGYFTLPGEGTGIGVTPDQNSLLAFTNETTSAFQSAILDRSLWLMTPGFQRVILPNIGCVAGRTVVSQWGMLWWLAQGGLVGLDDALTSFRSSRIHFRDAEMSRSKANISSDISGACAGAFENFLVLSVPSGDTYNAHTWVMDQGIIEGINSEAPPAWASCWTGTFPVQWVTKVIKGVPRCFHFSRGRYTTTGSNAPISDVWESFLTLQKDITYNISGTRALKNISWSMETKFLSEDGLYKRFGWVEIMLVELAHLVNVACSYSTRHGGYKQVLSKQIVADVDNVAGAAVTLSSRLKQTRRVRSLQDVAMSSDATSNVEDINTRNKDKGFFIMVSGTGEASVENITLYAYTDADQLTGRSEVDETTLRYVSPGGAGVITNLPFQIPTIAISPTSGVPQTISPRTVEVQYSSL